MLGCGSDETSGQNQNTETQLEDSGASSTEKNNVKQTKSGTEATKSGAETKTTLCNDGKSLDPPEELLSHRPTKSPTVLQQHTHNLVSLFSQYPRSSTLRVRAAGMVHWRASGMSPEQSGKLYREALELHDRGCRLSERDEWQALEGLAVIQMMQSNYKASIPLLHKVIERWPTSAQSHYNLACAHCRLGDIDTCHAAFFKALKTAATDKRPSFFPAKADPASHYIKISFQDPDLESLRRDPRYKKTIESFRGKR